MKVKLQFFTAVASLALLGNAMAQSITVPTEVVQLGNTGVVTLSYTAGGDTTNLDFTMSYDENLYDEANITVACNGTALGLTTMQCSVDTANNQVKGIGVNFGTTPLVSGAFADVSFPVLANATTGDSVSPFSSNFSAGGVVTPLDTTWTLTVSEGPQPLYTSDPIAGTEIVMSEVQNNPNPSEDVDITNTGDAGSTLTGGCNFDLGTDSVFILSGDENFSVDEGAAAAVVTVSCDASGSIGSHTGTMECSHNGPSSASPASYALRCDILSGPPADYASSPYDPGDTIDMTLGSPVPENTPVADIVLTISNAAPEANADNLVLSNCGFTGSSQITATDPGSLVLAAQGGSTTVTFSCDSSASSETPYSGTYSCDYDVNNDQATDGTATYPVSCAVRAAASDIEEMPGSGDKLGIVVPINGTGQTSVEFEEILDEGESATIDSCSLTTANFSVVTTLPITVESGAMEEVFVEGTDPADGSTILVDVLTCTYTDSDSDPGTASWPITLFVNTTAVPTLSTWGLMAMILTMLGLGGIVIRRKTLS